MKLFVLNLGYRGGIGVFAPDRETAKEILKNNPEASHPYHENDLEEIEIKQGQAFELWGDR